MIQPIAEHDVTDPLTHQHAHAGIGDPNIHHGHTPEEIRKEMRVYLWVFGGLAFLTAVTVYACYGLKMPTHKAILIALATIRAVLQSRRARERRILHR